jgi:hypothetical protein
MQCMGGIKAQLSVLRNKKSAETVLRLHLLTGFFTHEQPLHAPVAHPLLYNRRPG